MILREVAAKITQHHAQMRARDCAAGLRKII